VQLSPINNRLGSGVKSKRFFSDIEMILKRARCHPSLLQEAAAQFKFKLKQSRGNLPKDKKFLCRNTATQIRLLRVLNHWHKQGGTGSFVRLARSFEAIVYRGCYSLQQLDMIRMIFQNFREEDDISKKGGDSRHRSLGRVSAGGKRKTSKSRKRKGSRGSR